MLTKNGDGIKAEETETHTTLEHIQKPNEVPRKR